MSNEPHDPGNCPVADQAQRWVVRLASGGIDRGELDELHRWLDDAPAHRAAFEEARTTWQMASLLKRDFARAADDASTPRHHEARRVVAWVGGLAAAAVVALAVLSHDLLLGWRSDFRTVAGEQRSVGLPDGSTVALNTESAIAVRYDEAERRVVLLQGEAFFDVARDARRPFVVAALDGTAQAVGTAFAVRETDGQVAVAVAEGTVRVASSEAVAHNALLIEAGQAATYREGHPPKPAEPSTSDRIAPWRNGKIVFNGLPFGTALAELDRYFPGHILLVQDVPDDRLVSGVFSTDAVDGAITALAETQGLSPLSLGGFLVVLH